MHIALLEKRSRQDDSRLDAVASACVPQRIDEHHTRALVLAIVQQDFGPAHLRGRSFVIEVRLLREGQGLAQLTVGCPPLPGVAVVLRDGLLGRDLKIDVAILFEDGERALNVLQPFLPSAAVVNQDGADVELVLRGAILVAEPFEATRALPKKLDRLAIDDRACRWSLPGS